MITGCEELQKARSNLSTARHLALVILSENLTHDVRGVPAPHEKTKGSRPFSPGSRRPITEPPCERIAPQGDLALAFKHSGNRTIDDGIGETPASQFVGHFQATAATAKYEFLGTSFREGDVIDVATLDEDPEGRRGELRVDAAAAEMLGHFGRGARGVGEIAHRRGHRFRRSAPRRRLAGVRSGRS